jgi:outer membrane immunogenic protein
MGGASPHPYLRLDYFAMKPQKLALALAIFAAASSPALANTADWTGFYVGGTAGHADGDSDVTTSVIYAPTGYFSTTSTPAITAAGAGQVDPSGSAFGLTAGYNWQWDSLVFGFEGDWSALNADDDRSESGIYPCCAPTGFNVYEKTSADDLVTLRARIGYAANNSLFYFTAGWAQVDVEIDDEFTDNYDGAHESFSNSESQDDWVWGLGYEHDFGNNWSVKAEYLRADFGTVGGTSTNLTSDAGADTWPENVFTHTSDLDLRVIRIGVNYRF